MALRLNDWVVEGTLRHNGRWSVSGSLLLRDDSHIILSLVGRPEPDLAGWNVNFKAREPDEPPSGTAPKLALEQNGSTGEMTAARQVRIVDGPLEDFLEPSQDGERPPTRWARCLYLEWFGPNGRVVVELVDPELEFVDHHDLPEPPAPEPPAPETPSVPGVSVTEVRIDEQGNARIRDIELGPNYSADDEEEDPDDPFGLFPPGMQRELDREADVAEAIAKHQDDLDEYGETALMDALHDSGPGVLIGSIFDHPIATPHPDDVDEAAAEVAMKRLIAELALFNIGISVCDHYSARDIYRWLIDELCAGQHSYPELRGTGWTTCFMTSEFCSKCDEEFEREYEERERQRAERGDDPLASDDEELPF